MYEHCTHTSVYVQNCTSFPIIPDQPCDAGESLLRAGAGPSELPPSWHQSFQLTDHPGAACHVQIATAKGSPHTHCCHACHPLLQSHRFPQESQTSGAVCTREEPARNRGISGTLPTILAAGATYRQGVGEGSYNLVTPARSIGPLIGSFSSSNVLNKTRW